MQTSSYGPHADDVISTCHFRLIQILTLWRHVMTEEEKVRDLKFLRLFGSLGRAWNSTFSRNRDVLTRRFCVAPTKSVALCFLRSRKFHDHFWVPTLLAKFECLLKESGNDEFSSSQKTSVDRHSSYRGYCVRFLINCNKSDDRAVELRHQKITLCLAKVILQLIKQTEISWHVTAQIGNRTTIFKAE